MLERVVHHPDFAATADRLNRFDQFGLVTDDFVGILIVGGGISGVLRALREAPEDRRKNIREVCRDIGPETRKGLSGGLITAALCHPLEKTSATLVQTMVETITQGAPGSTIHRTVAFFDIVTPENM
ncbi:hypothetical protein [Ensifer sp. 4252]|uniref:hypothetical protein n=1 Tax=Ensifer sp. 4252 TaxID=3373915 RepID=UPI003D20BB52